MGRSATLTSPGKIKKLLLELLPDQGLWTDEKYLWLTDHTSRLVEFTDGYLEVLPMPTDKHQNILGHLYMLFRAFVLPLGGKVQFAALRLQLREGKYREPDLLLLLDAKDPRRNNRFWTGADLVLEVVSPDNPRRDLIDKRHDYAEAGIPEYWIVDPRQQAITVLVLKGKKYLKGTSYGRGKQAASALLKGFSVDVSEVFDVE